MGAVVTTPTAAAASAAATTTTGKLGRNGNAVTVRMPAVYAPMPKNAAMPRCNRPV